MGLADGGAAAGNASDGAARRRLQARNSVTALFGAEKLWAAGFRGARVRMGVFDTGIRADHPHVKNIRCALTRAHCAGRGAFASLTPAFLPRWQRRQSLLLAKQRLQGVIHACTTGGFVCGFREQCPACAMDLSTPQCISDRERMNRTHEPTLEGGPEAQHVCGRRGGRPG